MNTLEEIQSFLDSTFVPNLSGLITETQEKTAFEMIINSFVHSSDGIISITYSELSLLIQGSELRSGQIYLITDFQTIYDRPDFDLLGDPEIEVSTITAAIEPLLVQSISATELKPSAVSLLHPKDRLKYDVSFSETEVNASAAKGRITERIDSSSNRTDYDHRSIQFKRYDIDGTGKYYSYRKTAFDDAGELFPTFPTDSIGVVFGDYAKFYDYYSEPFLLANNCIVGTYALNCSFNVGYMKNNTFQDLEAVDVTCAYFQRNTVLQFFNSHLSCYNFSGNTFGAMQHTNVETNFQNCNLGNWSTFDSIVACDFTTTSYSDFGFDIEACIFTDGTQVFRNNEIKCKLASADFSAATHVFSEYTCTILTRSDNQAVLTYLDNTNALVITNYND